MPAFVKSKRDEELWSRAKRQAEEQGRKGDWAYVTGIFKKMKGGKMGSPESFTMQNTETLRTSAGPSSRGVGWSPASGAVERQEQKATYQKFMQQMQGRKFRNPDTGNEVLFVSLPSAEQHKIYQQWAAGQQAAPEEKAQKAEAAKPDTEGFYSGGEHPEKIESMVGQDVEIRHVGYPQVQQGKLDSVKQIGGKPYASWTTPDGKRGGTELAQIQVRPSSSKTASQLVALERLDAALAKIEKLAGYSKEFLAWTKGRKFRNPNTHRDVQFVSLPPSEKEAVHRKWERMQQHGGGEEGYSKKLRKELVDWHRSDLVPSPGGKGREQAKPDLALLDEGLVYRDTITDRGRQHVVYRLTPEGRKIVDEEKKGRGKRATYSEEFLKQVKGKKFKHPDTGNMVLFTSLPSAEQKRVHQQMSKATGKPEPLAELATEEAIALLQQRALDFKPSAENRRNLQRMLEDMGSDDVTVRAPMKTKTEKKAYSEEFMQWAENMSFTNPDTGNKVKFVSLPPERQAQIHAQYEAGRQKAQEQAAQKAEKKPKKPKRPTFPQAREAAFGALEEAGWSVKKHLKVPKAEREIDGERVILHFHPQAVYMEIKNKSNHPLSLHTDIRDVDPKQWVESLAGEARSMVELEERLKAATGKQAHTETQMTKQDRLKRARTRWAQMSPEDRDAMRRAFADMFQGPVVHAQPVPGQTMQRPGEEPPEPPPPAEVKRMLADRMRDLARSLMVAGMRQPRQQMMEIAKALDLLLEQLDMLADQPGRDALRRRILLNLRQRITSGKAA